MPDCVDTDLVTHESGTRSAATNEFSIVRKGYEQTAVDARLAEYEEALAELEEYAARLQHELKQAKLEISRLQSAEQESIDQAMAAVFEAKERIMAEAMARARQIEDQARAAAGLPIVTAEPDPIPLALAAEEPLEAFFPQNDALEPNAVLEKMLQEAESIRDRLDDGLAAAFDHMEQMQREAEQRAANLIEEARQEAAQLRAVAAAAGPEVETAIAVNLSREGLGAEGRPSRYSRNSASLPRIGNEGGPSIMATMNGLRTKMREEEVE